MEGMPAADAIFEFLVALMLSCFHGVQEAWVVPRSEDQGIDGGALYDLGTSLGPVQVVFQAKLQSRPVGRRVVDQVRGSLFREDASIGYVVTNATLTAPARNSASNDHPRVRFINGTDLVQTLVAHGLGFHSAKSGATTHTYIDLTFFEQLRNVVLAGSGRTGRIRVHLDALGQPALFIP
jgi:hypothetical protein